MDTKSTISSHEWHIPRPSLTGSTASGSIIDSRSRGGSASSQGSASNHSTHSISSGSFLLNAAHLARMNGRDPGQDDYTYHSKLASYGRKAGLSEAVVAIPEETRDQTDNFWSGVKRGSATGQDATSVASSTHFTVVNGFTKQRPGKEPKSCCCDQSHQVTVLVISMTILFSACILAAICFVETKFIISTNLSTAEHSLSTMEGVPIIAACLGVGDRRAWLLAAVTLLAITVLWHFATSFWMVKPPPIGLQNLIC